MSKWRWSWLYPLTFVQEPAIKQNWNQRWKKTQNFTLGYLLLGSLLLSDIYNSADSYFGRWLATLSRVPTVIHHSTTSYFWLLAIGALSNSSPFQVPGLHIICSAASAVASATIIVASPVASATFTVSSAFRCAIRHSETANMFQSTVKHFWTSQPRNNVTSLLVDTLSKLPGMLASDTLHLRQAITQLLVAFVHQLYTGLFSVLSTLSEKSETMGPSHVLEVLQSSPNNAACQIALEFLARVVVLDDFDPTLVTECFNVLSSFVSVIDSTVAVAQESEELAALSATCFLYTYSHLSVMDPMSGVLEDVHQHYNMVFPLGVDFKGLPFYYTLGTIHELFNSDQRHQQHARIEWQDYKPPSSGCAVFTCSLTKLALSEYQRRKKVPCWILHFVLHSMSLDPSPSTPDIVECLSIIAIGMGCNISRTRTILDNRYVHTK